MALLFMESWDGYGSNAFITKWYGGGNLITSSPTPRTGTYANQSNSLGRNISPASATLIIGFAFYWGGVAGGELDAFASPSGGGNTQWSFFPGADGKVRIYHSASFVGPLLEESANAVLIAGSWNFIEVKVLCANSGTWAVKVNGATVLSGSGDTMSQASATLAALGWICGTNNAVDDMYVLDSTGGYLDDFIGDCKVECLLPSTGNGTNVGLTTSTGADHGALVDDLPPNDDTDYNSGSTAGVKDTYNFPSLTTTGTVQAVQATARAKKTDSATKTLALVTRISTTDYDGTTQNVASTSYGEYVQIWEKRPSDSNVWTPSDVNAAEFGLKVVS